MSAIDAPRVALYCARCTAFVVTVAAPPPPVRVICTECKGAPKN